VTAGHITRSAVRSADGTSIAFECSGGGPTLVLIEPAGHWRVCSAFGQLGEQLVAQFTVVGTTAGAAETVGHAPVRR
jgi:hypothetical protein